MYYQSTKYEYEINSKLKYPFIHFKYLFICLILRIGLSRRKVVQSNGIFLNLTRRTLEFLKLQQLVLSIFVHNRSSVCLLFNNWTKGQCFISLIFAFKITYSYWILFFNIIVYVKTCIATIILQIVIYLHPKVADFDGDNVRCRFASGSDGCASICSNHSAIMILNEVGFLTQCKTLFRIFVFWFAEQIY